MASEVSENELQQPILLLAVSVAGIMTTVFLIFVGLRLGPRRISWVFFLPMVVALLYLWRLYWLMRLIFV